MSSIHGWKLIQNNGTNSSYDVSPILSNPGVGVGSASNTHIEVEGNSSIFVASTATTGDDSFDVDKF